MRIFNMLAAVGLVVSLAACGPNGANRGDAGLAIGAVTGGILGSTIGKGRGRTAATAIGAVIGGIVGSEIGRDMDRRDRELARETEFYALERGDPDVPRRWRNRENGHYGEFTPSRPYRRASRFCRDYTHRVYIGGRPQVMRGTACRNEDGTWRNVG